MLVKRYLQKVQMADGPRHGSARRAERRDRAIPPREARRGGPHKIMKPVPPRLD